MNEKECLAEQPLSQTMVYQIEDKPQTLASVT